LEWKPKKRDHETVRAPVALPFSLVQTFFAPVAVRRREPRRDAERSTERPRTSTRGKSGADRTTRSYPLYLERSAISTAFIDRAAKQTLKRRPFVGKIEKIAIFVQ